MATWKHIPIDTKLFLNVRETVLRRANAAIENAFVNEAGGHTRWPGLKPFCTLVGSAPTYLHDYRGDLIAESGGRVYRIRPDGTKSDVTGAPVTGDGRAIFAETTDELVIAKGGDIIRLGADKTELLSPDAPQATHVAYIDGYLLANEVGSGIFWHSKADSFREWDPLDAFAASGQPDEVNALVVTGYREIIVTGPRSVEQFERMSAGPAPFFRRWASGGGVIAPYTIVAEDQGVFAINKHFEFVRFTGQVQEPVSDDVGRSLEDIDDWTGAWAASVRILGQKFILLQMPAATNTYGTKGVTMLFDFRSRKWSSLYGWDSETGQPTRWPGWSYHALWGRHFVGGEGKVLELVEDTCYHDGTPSRMLGRTAHFDEWGEVAVQNVRVRLKVLPPEGGNGDAISFGLRCTRDQRRQTRWKYKSIHPHADSAPVLEFGPMGFGHTFQFEWQVVDDAPVEVVRMEALVASAERY